MDAFDNPARNGNAGLQRGGGSTGESSQAVSDSEFLVAAAHVTAAASALPLAIQAILVPDASGRIVLPAGASVDDISVSGADLIVTLPNGQILIIPNGAVDIPSIVIDGDTVPASTVAQLLENLGELNPEAGTRSSGGNFADPEGPIQDAYALGDLLPYTELAFSQPEDRELLPAVPDDEPEIVIVTPDQPAGAAAATASVDEAGLPVREGEPAGSASEANSETTTGSIVYDAADGLDAITINGTAVTAVGQVITTPLGQLTITSLTPGNVGYSYTLADNSDANGDPTDIFTVVVTDRDGDTATATLTIDVVDDVPTARADTDAVAAGSFAPEAGNVLTGAGTTSGAAGADTPGADDAVLTGIRGADGEGGFSEPGTVQGQYGTLTIGADGGYSYVRDPGTPGGVDDIFTYQITDGDGDTSTATLTIRIADAPTVITFVPGEGDDGTIVYEADLAGRDGETPGSAFGGGEGGGASTSGTITFTSLDGVGSVSIGGVTLTPGALPQTIASDATGTLVVTGYSYDPATGEGSVTYVYTLIDNTLDGDGTRVSFDLTITDVDGDAATDTLDIAIVDDAPTARADSDSVTEDGPATADGNVLTGLGGGDANATDGVADTQGADGATVTGVAGGSVGEPLAGAYGSLTLNGDGSYSYVLDNASQPVQGLSAGEVLTDSFTYTITDGDGDISTTTLTITINGADDGVTVDGLDGEGAELTVDEDDLADGSSPDAAALTQDGSFTVSTPDGLGNVTIGGVQVVTNGVFAPATVPSPLGTVNITGFTPVTGADGSVIGGTFTYEYVLADNTLTHGPDGEDSVIDSFDVVVTDSDGSTANASLDVRIVDDVPTARDDSDNVTEDGPAVADGNVLTGLGGGDANATDGVADTQGADGAAVTAVTGGTIGAAFATSYGVLTLNGDGSYSYALANASQAVQGLSAGEVLTDSVTYTITDGDGDTATATLTIAITGADDGVTITGLDAEGAELFVDEDDLPARAGEAPGSDTAPDGVTDGDSFAVSTPDGMGTVVLDSFNGVPLGAPLTLVTADGSFTPQSVTTAYGTLSVTGFTPVIGSDGSVIGGSFTYSYTLTDNRTDHPAAGQDDRTDSVGVTVTDADGSSASAAIDIRITDDVPDAIDDGTAQTVENAPVTIDVLANDGQGADSVQPSAVALVAGSLTGAGTLVNNGDGSFTYTPAAQESGTVSFQYRITDGDGDTDVATATITLVADSAPQIGKVADLTVDEDGLAGANIDNGLAGEVTSTGSASASGTIIVDFGSDVPATLAGSLVLNDAAALDTQLTVGGVPVTFAKVGDDLVGSVGGNEVIRIGLTSATAGPGATEVTYGYTVTLSQAVDQALPGVEDSDLLTGIGFTVTDSDGTQSSGAFGVTIVDDLPTLSVSDAPTSVVEGATANGTWTLDAGADGVASVLVSFGSGSATLALTPGSSVSIAQPTGTLTVGADGSFSFAAAADQDDATNPSATFTLSAVDRDGDPTSDSLTIAITDGANPINATPITLTVNEAALDAIGSDPASNAETAGGNLSFTAGSDTLSGFVFTGVAGLVANLDGAGTDIFWSMAPDGQTITGSLTLGGPAAITIGLTAPASIALGATANASVTVTLADNLPHALANAAQTQALGTVTVQATDTDGDPATGVVTVQVIDDIPAANPDADSVAEDGALIADGNVLTGSGGSDANATDGAADTQGADGAAVTALVGGTVGAPLVSTYGTLTLNADGSYSYVLDNSNTAVQGLSAGQTLTETFTYTITDGDGDPATTTLTITIDGANDGVTINGLAVPGGEEIVDEDDLADGSSPDAAALTQTGSFTVAAPDGLDDVTIGTAPVMVNGVFTPGLTTTSPLGTVTITGFTPVTASDGSVIGGTFTYEYVLGDNTLTHPAAGEDNVTESFPVTVTDSDGSGANASLDIVVIDDVPAAAAEPNQNVAEGATVTGTLDFVEGADGASVTQINGTALVFGMDGYSQGIDIGDGTIKVKADGSYSFTADAAVAGTGSASATYTVTDGDGDTSTAPITFTIVDANVPTAGTTQASVDDDALLGGNPASMTGDLPDANGDGDNDQATFSGALNLDFGGDGAGSVSFAAMDGQTAMVGTEMVTYDWNAGTLTATGPRGALFTVEVTDPATGAYTVTLLDNVLHTAQGDENDASATLGFVVSDSDGSTAPGTLEITFDDDAPTVTAGGTQPVLTVDETALGTDAQASFASVFTPVFGADGAALANPTTYALGINAGATGLVDTATNEAVVLSVVGGVVQGRTATSDALVFTIGVAADGTVTLDQIRAVVHAPDSGPDQPAGLVADNLVTLTATVTDGDGDTASATANIGQNLVFRDDAPVANDDSAGLTEGGPSFVTFDVDTNDNNGADGLGSRTFTSLTGSYGTITLNGDGTQTYTLTPDGQAAIDGLAPGATLTDIFTYTLTDKDGDSDPATLTVTLTGTDDGVTITNLTPKLDGGDAVVDEDDLPAGSDTMKESLTQTGSFTISAPDGVADLSVHGVQVIANGVFTPATIVTPLGNTLDITAYDPANGEVSYSYTLGAAETHGAVQGENSLFEDFVVELTDADGDNTDSLLSINIVDDIPTAAADADIVVAEDAAPVGGNLLANDTQGADGATLTSVTIGGNVTLIAAAGTTVIPTANGIYSFTATGVWTFDPNPVNNAAAVDAGFSYTITDGDGDIATATQAISLTDGAGPLGGGSITLALDDQNLSDGSTPAGPDSANDTLVFTPGSDAIASIVFANSLAGLGGGLTWVRVSDTQVTGSDGARLVVTLDLVRVGNSASVTATLNDNYDSHPGLNLDDLANLGSVGVVATDADGDTATGSVAVTVSDDLPTARADSDAVTEDAPGGATGNVMTGIGTTNAPGSADTQGADGASVTGVAVGTSATAVAGNVGAALGGSYGSLTLGAGGGYTYALNNGNAAVQALGVGETLTETFTYTITDGDGDQSTTTLTITINGANDLPTIGSSTTAVSDEGLAGGLPDSVGTVDTTNLTLRTGTIAVGDPDGDPLTLSLGAPATALFSGGQPIVWDTTNPQLLLGKVGTETIISVAIDNGGNFTVSLQGPIDHPDTTLEDALSLVVPVSANDGTTTVTNAAALTIGLEDDAPAAIAPLAAALINAPGASVYQSLDSDGDVDNNYGGDGPGSVIFTAATIAALQAQELTSGGQMLTYVISANGTVLTAEKPNGDDVFIIRLQPAGHADQYQVEMVQKLDSTATIDFNSGGYDIVGGNTAWIGFTLAGDNNSPDILITPMTNGVDGGKMNANATNTGVSDGNSVGPTEAVRIDFVVDLTGTPGNNDYAPIANQTHAFDSHYSANGASAFFSNINSSSSVRIVARDDIDTDNDVGDGVQDIITGVAISYNGSTLIVTTAGIYNVGGQNYTVSFSGGEATIDGVVADTRLAGFTADGYNSIEFHHAGGDTFKIGDFGAVVQTENPVNFEVPVTIVDGDGDTAPGSLSITTASPLLVIGSATGDVGGEATDHVVANPQGLPDGAIAGGAFDDTLVGDPGSVTITEGQQANVVLVLDSSGSMTTQIAFGGGTISRMQALKNGVNALIDSLSQSGALDVRITVIDFDSDGDNLGTFNLIVNGVVQAAQVTAAKAAVNGMTASGSTNYEDGLQDALSWINGGNGITGADVNKVVFVSDGNPTVWNNGGNGDDGDATNVQNSMNQVLGSDGTNEPQQILATGYSIDSVGVNVNASLLARLSDVEDGNASGGTGSATNATSAEQLAAVLQVLGGSTDLAAAGNDTINGGDGADIIFGDVLYTDALAAQLGVNLSPGSGWAVFQTLEGRVNAEAIDPAGNGADWNRQDTIAYVRANYTALAQESGRTGGNDTINAGAGNDIILGQEGNDTINAGGGDDLIQGGTGRDVMTGGTGGDTYVFNAGDSRPTLGGSGNGGTITGHDVITDFNLAADILNLPGTPVPDGNGAVDGTNSVLTISGQAIRSHSVTNGVITFDDNNSFANALTLSSDAHVAAAVDYLQRNDLGPAGTTVAFVAGTRTFVYQQVGADANPANDILIELQGVTITNLTTLIGTRVTPVTLDLGGDGLDFVPSSAGAAFDHDGDGVREATSWAGRGDGILVRDANGDGIANHGGEISFSVAGSTDLEGLRLQYDSNGDGRLSAGDAEFASFGVWQDANGDGLTDAGEFRSLADLGIVSIALTSDGNAYVAGEGEVIVHGEASFTRTDGSSGAVGDVSFITPRAANDAERTAGTQALTSSLVAASLVALVHDAQPDGPVMDKMVSENAIAVDTAEGSGTVAATGISGATTPPIANETALESVEDAPSVLSTAATPDDPAAASIDEDRGDWRNDTGTDAPAERDADALFDQVADHIAPAHGLMDGLFALAALPADAGVADAAAHDPAATAVLAEVIEGRNAVDQLIDAVAKGGAAQVAGGETPAFDLAHFLGQSVAPGAAIMPHPAIEQDLHQLATA
ncbi:beta strand repeat-containing protein [Sphingopyxis chilensis]|uniref:beta strand repeat-containing protein n=1 Tax=Sphingopyxis chilensis TaxID=180400 RepID=UPI002DDDA9D7|nr:VCBS domain-containing protein [Sphingopyxis chilensis]